jgi:spermidine/putrescine transport system permease protein
MREAVPVRMRKMSFQRFKRWHLPKIAHILPLAIAMVAFVVIPLTYIFIISFCSKEAYVLIIYKFNLMNYMDILQNTYLRVFLDSMIMAFETTALCILIAYPFAYFVCKKGKFAKSMCMMFIIVPFFTSSIVRTYGWMVILRTEGVINTLLISLHIIKEPLQMLYTNGSVILGMAYTFLPFMILPLVSSIGKLDPNLLEASADLGARKSITFLNVTLPLTMPGIFAGTIMVFIPSLGYFYIPEMLGGSKVMLVGNLIKNQFYVARNWPFGAALSVFLIILTLILVSLYKKTGGDVNELGL